MRILLLFVLLITFSCSQKSEKKVVKIQTQLPAISYSEELLEIEKNGRTFYDWYFKNDFPNCAIIEGRKGKCALDTIGYFKTLRSLGTISEKFIDQEKERLNSCSEYISTIDYSEYENADAYEYDQYCIDIYYMYWIKSQEEPKRFSTKNAKRIDEKSASLEIYVNYGGKDELLSTISLGKEGSNWMITEIKFFNRENEKAIKGDFYANWENSMVILHVQKDGIAFEYHGQCMYFYPLKKINDTEFEMIWAREMDCVFDNGTDEKFGLKNTPKIGQPFSKLKLKNDILYVEYYYKDWVKKYTEKVQQDVFTSKYFRRIDNY